MIVSVKPAIARFHWIVNSPKKKNVDNGMVLRAVSISVKDGNKKSFQMLMTFKIMTVAVMGFSIGKIIRQKTPNFDAPSIVAASSNVIGMDLIKPWYKNTERLA